MEIFKWELLPVVWEINSLVDSKRRERPKPAANRALGEAQAGWE